MVRYIVYGRGSCPFCVKAVQLLEDENREFIFFNEENKEELDYIKKFYASETVPIIIENNVETGKVSMVGGDTDLRKKLK